MNNPVTVYGDVAVIAKLKAFPAGAKERLAKTVLRLSIMLQGYIMSEKLSGQVLKNRTGNLRNSIKQEVRVTDTSVLGVVGVGVNASKYGRAHEYGFHETVNVKAHLRTQKMAWGKSITPVTVEVRAHPMRMNLKERSFLRSALADKADTIREELTKAVTGRAN